MAISTLVEQNMLYPELVLVLETLKIKDVHDFGESIETKLTQNIIKVFKVFEKEES